MRFCILALISAVLLGLCVAQCPVDVKQSMVSSFVEDGRFSSQWRVELGVGRDSGIVVSSLRLSLTPPSPAHPIAHVRGMDSAGPSASLSSSPSSAAATFYRLPSSHALSGGLKSGHTHSFDYVVRGMAPASISLASVSCSADKSDHSSSSLPFYAGPWFSFFNKKDKPAASLGEETKSDKCVIKVDQLARAQKDGGSWTDGEFAYRTYDLKVTNIGREPLTGSLIRVSLGPDEELYEWWNVVRPTATEPVLKLTTRGGLESGLSVPAGYVVRAPIDAPVRDPELALSKVSCFGSEETTVEAPRVQCRANINITARADKDRSRWSDGDYFYQVYDLKLVNMGDRLITDARITLNAASGAELIQWWEVNRQASANVFHPDTPIRVGTALIAGIIERVPLAALANYQGISALVDSISCV